MAFNPFTTFQKNRRFWMAMILMVCMISFVFCTGMKGDMQDRILAMFGRRGTTIASVGQRNVTREELYELKTQRKMASEMMLRCTDIVFKKVSKEFSEGSNKPVEGKEPPGRKETLTKLLDQQKTLALRKSRPNYFDIGTKFDDLLEFKLWQAQADKMGIRLEDEHVRILFHREFFDRLSFEEEYLASSDVRRNNNQVGPNYLRRAIAEEFRVKIAQLAVLEAQPYSFFTRMQKKDGLYPYKLTEPRVPDEIRAPMTLSQLWDYYRSKREEFDVTLIPIPVQSFVKEVDPPTVLDQKNFFEKNKNRPYDPTTGDWGLEIPTQIKVEYLMADPFSSAYLDRARIRSYLEVTSPLSWNPFESPMVNASRYLATSQAEQKELQRQYEVEVSHSFYRLAAPYSSSDWASPLLAWTAKRHPQAAASLVNNLLGSPFDSFAALSGYLAWGEAKESSDVQLGLRAELYRRAPFYGNLFGASMTAGAFNSPLEMVGYALSMDQWQRSDDQQSWVPVNPLLPYEVVGKELRDMKSSRQAEEWARASMKVVKEELDNAKGDSEKFKRVLKKYVPLLNLTHGPPKEFASRYYDRYSIRNAEELEPLRQSFMKYVDLINYYEGRDTAPETLLKPDDFYKLFFDSTVPSAVTSSYQAMPWPPDVTPNNIRIWKDADPRFIKPGIIKREDIDLFQQHMRRHSDPNRPVEPLKFFETAEKPILFWRTTEIPAQRPSDYDKFNKDLSKLADSLKKIQEDLAQARKNQEADKVPLLSQKERELKKQLVDYTELQNRITQGLKFERARTTKALPKAAEIARKIIDKSRDPLEIQKAAEDLTPKQKLIVLEKVSQMHPDHPIFTTDYFTYPLPKEKIAYPREDMASQLVNLLDMKQSIEIKDPRSKDADTKDPDLEMINRINKELYETVKNPNTKNEDKDKKKQEKDKLNARNLKGEFVQILTDKPRSVYYVAVVTSIHRVELPGFVAAIAGAPFQRQIMRNLLFTHAQEEEAKRVRAEIVRDLGRVLGYSDISDEARKSFDERAVD